MKRKRFPQDFLFENKYMDIDLSSYQYHESIDWVQNYKEPINLFDFLHIVNTRTVSVSDLNNIIRTDTDWNKFIEDICLFERIIFIREPLEKINPIVKKFEENQIKAYIYNTELENKEAFWI